MVDPIARSQFSSHKPKINPRRLLPVSRSTSQIVSYSHSGGDQLTLNLARAALAGLSVTKPLRKSSQWHTVTQSTASLSTTVPRVEQIRLQSMIALSKLTLLPNKLKPASLPAPGTRERPRLEPIEYKESDPYMSRASYKKCTTFN